MTRRQLWTIGFLGATFLAIGEEIVAGVWHPAGTIPWTEYIAKYIPWPFQLLIYLALAIWLPFHFWAADHRAIREYSRGVRDGMLRERTLRLRGDQNEQGTTPEQGRTGQGGRDVQGPAGQVPG